MVSHKHAGGQSGHQPNQGHPNVRLAVLDGAVDLSHPCFTAANLQVVTSHGVDGRVPANAPTAHGTKTASILFGQPGTPVSGMVPRCRGLLISVFDDGAKQTCSQLDLARAITRAVQLGAHIINISAGKRYLPGDEHPMLVQAIKFCEMENVLIVAAAGNDGCACPHLPAGIPSVLAVGAMDASRQPLGFSNWGEPYLSQGVLAAGENILGATLDGGASRSSGTSLACATVSGFAAQLLALQLSRGQPIDPSKVRAAILETAIGCDEEPYHMCDRLLAGRINPAAAIAAILNNRTAGSLAPITASTVRSAPQHLEQLQPTMADDVIRSTSSVSPPVPISPSSVSTLEEECVACDVEGPGIVYALGQVGIDFRTEARLNSFMQQGIENPQSLAAFLNHLSGQEADAASVIWTLQQESTPIYAIQPVGAFAANGYALLRDSLNAQLSEGAEVVSVPGIVGGSTTLMNGQTVPVIFPEIRGMYSWSTSALAGAVLGKEPSDKKAQKAHRQKQDDLENFLQRIYHELRNLGLSSHERAINYAATNAFQVERIFERTARSGQQLDTIDVERSPICNPGSDCWDVKLVFFNPEKRTQQAREIHRFTIDVSDTIPVTIGKTRRWSIY